MKIENYTMRKNLFLLFTFWSVITVFSQKANELNQQSKELLQKNQFDKAIPLLKQAAELGNPEAQYNLAYFLQNGEGTTRNVSEAIEWYKKSSLQNFNDSHYALMMAYGNGEGVEQNTSLAFEYAMKCANNNDATCIWNVANCYFSGIGIDKNETLFKEWLLKLVKLENPANLYQSGKITSARLELARYYRDGTYFPKDMYQSYLWYIIFNESKGDMSIMIQQEAIDELKKIENELTKNQIESRELAAEKLLGRKLKNIKNLYQINH